MKYLFTFLVTFLIGILIMIGIGIIQKNPGKPINNIIQTVAKPGFSIAEAPTQTIKGSITQISGNVNWESRTASDESSPISNPPPTIQQGEEIDTMDTGQVSLDFSNAVSINMAPKTQIEFVQTLPVNFVANIASGSAEFKKTGNIPLTIRSLHLLTKINEGLPRQQAGDVIISVNEIKSLVHIKIISGNITTAFNDTNLNSSVVDFSSPKEIIFNDLTRMFSI